MLLLEAMVGGGAGMHVLLHTSFLSHGDPLGRTPFENYSMYIPIFQWVLTSLFSLSTFFGFSAAISDCDVYIDKRKKK